VVFVHQGNLDQAFRIFTKVIELDREYVRAYNNLGIVFLRSGQFDQAINAFQKALMIDTNFSDASDNLELAIRQKNINAGHR